MESKLFSMCIMEKHIEEFYNNYTENKNCKNVRSLKRYFENKDKITIQRKVYLKKTKIIYYRNKKTDIYVLKKYLDTLLN